MERRSRFRVENTLDGYVVIDEVMNLRVIGPLRGPGAKRQSHLERDRLEREATSKRARKGER